MTSRYDIDDYGHLKLSCDKFDYGQEYSIFGDAKLGVTTHRIVTDDGDIPLWEYHNHTLEYTRQTPGLFLGYSYLFAAIEQVTSIPAPLTFLQKIQRKTPAEPEIKRWLKLQSYKLHTVHENDETYAMYGWSANDPSGRLGKLAALDLAIAESVVVSINKAIERHKKCYQDLKAAKHDERMRDRQAADHARMNDLRNMPKLPE